MVKVEVGQTVIVTDEYGHAKQNAYRGTVVKVARVWIDVHCEGQQWGWRFRLDTQTDGGDIGYRPRFYTLDQWAEKLQRDAADAFLRGQDVTVGYRSPWRDRKVELAQLMGWTVPPPEDGEQA